MKLLYQQVCSLRMNIFKLIFDDLRSNLKYKFNQLLDNTIIIII